mmetsp:Transcript_52828/g.146425  ORF Transcript_52828/g.146425 Transcript_52828/m.146425 type:complete len:227 (+) Transcript_52828:353-1033(+)
MPSGPPRSTSKSRPTRPRKKSGSKRKGPSPAPTTRVKPMPEMLAIPSPWGKPVTKITSMPCLPGGPSGRSPRRSGPAASASHGPNGLTSCAANGEGNGAALAGVVPPDSQEAPLRAALRCRTTSTQRQSRTRSSQGLMVGPLCLGAASRIAFAFRWKLARTSAGNARAPSRPSSCIASSRASSKTRHRNTESIMEKTSCVGWLSCEPPTSAAARPAKIPLAKLLPL